MPELPDLVVVRRRLEAALAGRRVEAAAVLRPLVLRLPVEGPLERLLAGRTLTAVGRRGKFLSIAFDDGARLVAHPMLTGVFALARRRGACLRLEFLGGTCLDYVDPKQMGKVYYLPAGRRPEDEVPGYGGLGPEAGGDGPGDGPSFEAFLARARGRRSEVRNLLLDQAFLAGVGSAYADEILWEAHLHPKRPAASLGEAEWRRLHRALRDVLAAGVAAVEAGLPPELGTKVRDHMEVRGRAGRPCPRCGAIVVRRHLGREETDFCPRCQPDPRDDFPLPERGQGW